MAYVFVMNERMTQRTDNHQIFNRIISSIGIFMMNSQYIRNFFVSTNLTFIDQVSAKHHFSNGCIFWRKMFLFRLIYTCLRAINSFLARTIEKFFATMLAFMINTSFSYLCFVIAFTAAILGFIHSAANMSKRFFAYPTNGFYLFPFVQTFTFSRTEFCRKFAVWFNSKIFSTKQTITKSHICL